VPRETKASVTQYGVTRTYRVYYVDDPPERAEAVAFFQHIGQWPCLTPQHDARKPTYCNG
jgi:hypothetical protein